MHPKLRNKLLACSFAASLVVNTVFLILVGNSDIFQHADVLRDLRAQQIKVYKPPIPQKPKPKPKPKPPPPPKQPKPIPRPVKPPPAKQVIRPVPHPARPKPVRVAQIPTSIGSHSRQGTIPVPQSSGTVGRPATTITPPAPQPLAPPAPRPTPVAPPTPRPAPVASPAPKPHMADRAEPEPDRGSWPDLDLPNDVDPSTVTNSALIISFEVDESGHPRHVRVKQSCGNSDIDDQARSAIERMHFKPAVQNGEPQEMDMEHEFDVSLG